MSQGCALLILRSKGQRSRSWRMVIWKWFPDDNWLCNQPMIMKLHTLTPHESRMCPIDFGVKRSRVKVMAHGYLKMVHRNNGCRFEFVGVGGGPVLLQQYFQYAFICCPYMLPLLFENGFRTITDSVINLWSWNFIHLLPMSQGCALLILGSKGQRSRSWRMVIWKWSTEIMVADLNLLGSVGDLYCFSNTFSMLFRAQEPKAPVTYCDHALSGVRPSSVRRPSVRRPSSVKLFTFSTSSPEPHDGFWWNLVGMKYSWSLTSVVVFRPDPPRGGSRAGQK